ncbi:MAG: aminotransferase class I/II-fold pyridoxal phosphate-dependent enzyme [Bacilli bacterium]|nr:aminotransferase class I/II-fold pyridoxal phosphate-dependent enzyme [Bacilli bacterium]
MKALMLAAGMGKRLGRYTAGNTKCMLKIGDKSLIERACEALYEAGINDFTIVIGYKGDNLKKFLLEECENPIVKQMNFTFIDNDIYNKTNNIYSLYLAKDELIKDDTIMLESDLIYDYDLIKRMVDSKEKNLVSVAKYKQWMDGTVVKLGNENNIKEFIEKKDFNFDEIDEYFKTINIYKFSKEFSRDVFVPFLDAYIKAYGENEYYELVLKIISHLSRSDLKALDASDIKWYEIDDAQDYDITNCLFSSGKEKLKNYQKRYGGYWRFDNLIDYCYLVNPYYPPQAMLDKINYESRDLLTQYPSGQSIECINASRLFNDTNEEFLCVGNGAAELINALGKNQEGNMAVTSTVFNEYVRCFDKANISKIDMSLNDYRYDVLEFKRLLNTEDAIVIVNPDNPTGSFIKREDIIKILDQAKKQNRRVIFDESFIDFANPEYKYSLINNEDLINYPNLVVVKSISKSYGIPGVRLGVLASSDMDLIKKIKKYISVWNINSYGEYFLQIANLYKKEYASSCEKIYEERNRFINELRQTLNIDVYDSEANFVMCDLKEHDSTQLAIDLLDENIFIKDLKTKDAFEGKNYIRLAVKSEEDNNNLIKQMKKHL